MVSLSAYQALLFDVDNTLTSTNKELFPEVIASLKAFADRNITIGTCTGKSAIALANYIFPHFPDSSHHIVCGGAQIVQTNGAIVWERALAPELAHNLLSALANANAKHFVVQPDAVYGSENLLDYLSQHAFGIPHKPLSMLPAETSIPMIGLYEIDESKRALLDSFGDQITAKIMQNHKGTQHAYCDITAAGVNKALAFQEWCQLLDIPPEKVMGFGDSENDLEFLKAVGYAVVMGNATDAIKAEADCVIDHVNNHGLSVYLSTLLEEGTQA